MFHPIVGSGRWRCRLWPDDLWLFWFCVASETIRRTPVTGQRVLVRVLVFFVVLIAAKTEMNPLTALIVVTGGGYLAGEVVPLVGGVGRPLLAG